MIGDITVSKTDKTPFLSWSISQSICVRVCVWVGVCVIDKRNKFLKSLIEKVAFEEKICSWRGSRPRGFPGKEYDRLKEQEL